MSIYDTAEYERIVCDCSLSIQSPSCLEEDSNEETVASHPTPPWDRLVVLLHTTDDKSSPNAGNSVSCASSMLI